jgi:BirA family biotin operon repressor/biotin-[acetyl-CoA-carboxylase] ligase
VKWPNDVQVNGRKLAGMLIDAAGSGQGVSHAIVGIGLNTGLDPDAHPDIAAIATSLSRELGRPVARLPVLVALMREIEAQYEAAKAGRPLVPEWRRHLVTLGKRVRVSWQGTAGAPGWTEEGLAEDVNGEGSLLLRRDDGSLVALSGGEVSLR